MWIPTFFYYLEASEKEEYAFHAPGQLDVSLLAQSQACWGKPFSSQFKPKRLIIADWRAPH